MTARRRCVRVRATARSAQASVAVLVVVLGAVLAPVAAEAAPGTGAVPAQASGACPEGEGVTVIVSFNELGGGTQVRCAPGEPASGLAALDAAGISWQGATRSPGMLCRIGGQPASDPCVNPPPGSAYWSYWIAPRGGDWCYSSLGPSYRKPPPGTVEGWSFSKGKSAAQTPRPGLAPPPGSSPAIPASHCTLPNRGAPEQQAPAAPPADPPPANPSRAPAPVPADPPPSVPAPGPAEDQGAGEPGAPGDEAAPAAPRDSTTTAPTSTTAGTGEDAEGEDDEGAGKEDEGAEDDSEVLAEWDEQAAAARGDGDVTAGGPDGGSPWPTVAGAVLVVAIGGGAAFMARRRRAGG
mgnify:CR=1 FL=1